jgi:hypothetical protein
MIALFTVIRMFSLSVCFSPKFGKWRITTPTISEDLTYLFFVVLPSNHWALAYYLAILDSPKFSMSTFHMPNIGQVFNALTWQCKLSNIALSFRNILLNNTYILTKWTECFNLAVIQHNIGNWACPFDQIIGRWSFDEISQLQKA